MSRKLFLGFAFSACALFWLLSDVVQTQVPTKAQIAFRSNRDGNAEIYVMDADGKNQRNLTNHPNADGGPAWSPDGKKIAFESTRDGNAEIYVMDVDGDNLQNLTRHLAYDGIPSWFDPDVVRPVSPAGRHVTIWGWLKQNNQ